MTHWIQHAINFFRAIDETSERRRAAALERNDAQSASIADARACFATHAVSELIRELERGAPTRRWREGRAATLYAAPSIESPPIDCVAIVDSTGDTVAWVPTDRDDWQQVVDELTS
jgi:hypothetical protein